MKYKSLESILLSLPGSSCSFPFDNKTPVFKVGGKMFALVGKDQKILSINLKCDPDDAQVLRSQFKAITPGYHMNKEHWNTILLDGSIENKLLISFIAESYRLVFNKLGKKDRLLLGKKSNL